MSNNGRKAKFKCNPSFTLYGEKFATCLRQQWDTKPICVSKYDKYYLIIYYQNFKRRTVT